MIHMGFKCLDSRSEPLISIPPSTTVQNKANLTKLYRFQFEFRGQRLFQIIKGFALIILFNAWTRIRLNLSFYA